MITGRYAGELLWLNLALSHMAPSAIDWTKKQIMLHGRVRLGPIEVTPDSISIARLVEGKRQIRFAELKRVGFDQGYLRFESSKKAIKIALRKVPNGLFLPEIFGGVGWSGEQDV